jgi:hypothetical protein
MTDLFRERRAMALGYFVPEDPDAYAERRVAAVGSYHFEFQHNRTAVKVSIPNHLIALAEDYPGCDEAVQELGRKVLEAARDAKCR